MSQYSSSTVQYSTLQCKTAWYRTVQTLLILRLEKPEVFRGGNGPQLQHIQEAHQVPNTTTQKSTVQYSPKPAHLARLRMRKSSVNVTASSCSISRRRTRSQTHDTKEYSTLQSKARSPCAFRMREAFRGCDGLQLQHIQEAHQAWYTTSQNSTVHYSRVQYSTVTPAHLVL